MFGLGVRVFQTHTQFCIANRCADVFQKASISHAFNLNIKRTDTHT